MNPVNRTVSLMAFAVIFSLVSHELAQVETPGTPQGSPGVLGTGAKIIVGGTIATALLALAAETSETGAEWATGLATLTLVTAMFVNGRPVWQAINNVFGGKPTTPTGNTPPTGDTGITSTTQRTTTA